MSKISPSVRAMLLRASRGSAFIATIALMAPVIMAPAHAQVTDRNTSLVEPGQIDKRLQDDSLTPSISPEISVSQPDTQGAPKGAENIRFTLKNVVIESATKVYSDAQLKSIYGNSINQTITLAEAYGIANALTAKYRNDGYILTQVDVPPQTIEGGTLRLRVIEGTLDQVRVESATEEGAAINLIKSYAEKIKTNGGPINAAQLERYLLLINDLPGVSARSILAPSQTVVGAADLTIIVSRDPYDLTANIDNYGSRYLGQWEGVVAGSLNSQLFNYNERISAQAAYAPGSNGIDHPELGYFSGSYWAPLGSYGTNVEASYSFTDTEPGYDLEQFDVTGRSHYAAVKLSHPFIRSREMNLIGRVLFDMRNVKTENILDPDRTDQIRALRAGARFEFIDTIFGAGLNTIDLEIAKGVHVFGASGKNDANKTRPLGDPQFIKVELEAERVQRITNSINLSVAVKGQLANDALLASEEFSLGGASGYGRAYDPSEITGDDGIAAKTELQWSNPVSLSWINQYQVFGFYDVGKVWNDDATTSSDVESLASTGAGFRFDLPKAIELETFVAVPLTRDVQTENDVDPRFYFSISKDF